MKRTKRKAVSLFFRIVAVIVTVLCVWTFSMRYIDSCNRRIYPKRYTEYVEKYSGKYSVPEEIIYSVILVESGFDKDATSHAGACGLMQITPDTYDWLLFLRGEEKENSLFVAETNIDFGTYFLSHLYKKFGSWETSFAAYNAGMNRVSEWLENPEYSDGESLVQIPFPETENYVKKVTNTVIKYKQIYEGEK